MVLLTMPFLAWAQVRSDVTTTEVHRDANGITLSMTVSFDIPNALQEALQKGVPLSFVVQADLVRQRWYWFDKVVTSNARQYRLSYLPLSRVWRLAIGKPGSAANLALNQNYQELDEALAAIRRIAGWSVFAADELDPNQAYRLNVRFALDATQLPRPFQISIAGEPDWNISFERTLAIEAEKAK
ncbi:DUF4390 domain-containing protein [Curvibacter sp. CHRR-16]|uniref:DUF4390 domain-containing protein n=1 Tax=Curvibacter sp. CHRR-16 TaxID=2835872 RepID=UPI001BD924F9|nr:DUF4390 domain-containing protein [Curvibacter sp. CHRR-16]MBT0571720.1 DUF4390 domain-containing protein [Curvibacter sp. CHRR-16]